MIYLCGPIDSVSEDEATTWRRNAADLVWDQLNMTCYDPARAFHHASMHDASRIDNVNRAAIALSDGVIAYMVKQPMFGTIRDIEFARANCVPVVMVESEHIISLSKHDLHEATGLVNAVAKLKELLDE